MTAANITISDLILCYLDADSRPIVYCADWPENRDGSNAHDHRGGGYCPGPGCCSPDWGEMGVADYIGDDGRYLGPTTFWMDEESDHPVEATIGLCYYRIPAPRRRGEYVALPVGVKVDPDPDPDDCPTDALVVSPTTLAAARSLVALGHISAAALDTQLDAGRIVVRG